MSNLICLPAANNLIQLTLVKMPLKGKSGLGKPAGKMFFFAVLSRVKTKNDQYLMDQEVSHTWQKQAIHGDKQKVVHWKIL